MIGHAVALKIRTRNKNPMNLNTINRCKFCNTTNRFIVGDFKDPDSIRFGCGTTVEKRRIEPSVVEMSTVDPVCIYYDHWECNCAKKGKRLHGISITDAPCRRCGSPIKSTNKDSDGAIFAIEYFCGSTLRSPAGKPFEFDALCRNAAKATMSPVVHYAGIAALSAEDRAKLESSGYVVVETQPDCKVQVMSAGEPLATADEIGMAALEAMQGPTNDSVRAKFAEILFRKINERTKRESKE